jgi:serine/threonine protein kinase/tetratricopeptide (TPR) repeat protein
MKPRADQLESILAAAVEIADAGRRRAFVENACSGDMELRHRVEALIDNHFQAGNFLEAPAASLAITASSPVNERPGTVIGAYKLLEQIGEGGFGIVFMAEQQQPIRRKVALKVLKPGMDTRQVIARFEAERQALALMDHPNIARVFDGGETAAGRPYFVMELVKGIPITDYCDQSKLTTRERLELFIHVCQAVQHAHQKGIIHRDLKPSNVLITLHDGMPVVKVIDFGIAKATGQQLTDKTLFTNFAQLVGTPMYMSPEQAALSGLDVDTRSDIYSLGVLLYELLTGTTPFNKERFKDVGYDEMRRIIREEEPPRPSTRMSTLGLAGATLSAQRKSDPRRLSQLFRGELDWIIMKCLDKDRNRRYETANGLAMDVQRYLHDEPVLACPPSTWYRLKKFGQRNKAALMTAALLAGILVLGTAVSIWQAFRATDAEGLATTRLEAETKAKAAADASAFDAQQQRTLAERNAEATKGALREAKANLKRADQNLTLALQALDDVYMKDVEDRIMRDRQMAKPERESLERGLKFYELFAQQNSGHAELEGVTAKAYRRAGSLRLELGDYTEAEAQLTKAIPVFAKLADQSATIADYRQELARCLNLLSETRVRARKNWKAEASCRQAVVVWQKLVDDSPKEPGHRVRLAASLLQLGQVLAMLNGPGGHEEAEKLMRRTLELYKALATEYPGNVGYRGELAWTYHELNHYVVRHGGRRREAVENQQQVVEILRKRALDSPDNFGYRQALGDNYLELGDRLSEAGQVVQAEEAYNQGLKAYEKLLADSPSADRRLRIGWAHVFLANFFRGTKKDANAEKAYRKAQDIYTKLIDDPSSHRSVMWRLAALAQDLANLLRGSGRAADADAVLRQAADSCLAALQPYDKWPADRNLPGDAWDFGNSYLMLGHVLKELGRFQEAADAYRRSLHVWGKVYADFNNADLWHWQWLAHRHIELGGVLAAAGKRQEAESAFRKAAEVQRQQETVFGGKPEYRRQLAEGQINAGNVLRQTGRLDDAVRAYREGINSYDKLAAQFPSNPAHRAQQSETLLNLGHLLRKNNRQRDAEEAYRQSLDAGEKVAKMSPAELWHAHMPAACYYHLGDLMLETKRYMEAEEFYRRAMPLYQNLLERFPKPSYLQGESAHIVQALATALRKTGRTEEALELMRDSLQGASVTPLSLNNIAWQFATAADLDQRDPPWALELAKLAVEREPDNGIFANTLGTAQYRVGDWKAALESLNKAHDLNQGQYFAHDAFFLAMVCWKLADKERAEKWYTAAERWMAKTAPKNEELLRFRAEAAALLGLREPDVELTTAKGQDHRELYTLVLQANPEAAWAYLERARLEQSRRDTKKADADFGRAIALYTRAIERKPEASAHWFNRGNAYAEWAQWEKASADLEKACAAKDAGPIPWYRHALLRLHLKDVAGYRKACATIMERFGKTDIGAGFLGLWACGLAPNAVADPAAHVRWAEKLVAAETGAYAPVVRLGAALYRAGRFEDARARLRAAQAMYKPADEQMTTQAYTCYFLAMVEQHLGHTKEARAWLNKAGDKSPTAEPTPAAGSSSAPLVPWNRRLTLDLLRREAEALLRAAAEAEEEKVRQEAIPLTKRVELKPKDPEPWIARGRFYASRGKTDRAAEDFFQAFKLGVEDPKLLDQGAHFFLDHGQHQRAILVAKRLLEKEPRNGHHWHLLGQIHYGARDYKAAVAAMHKAIEVFPSSSAYQWFYLAMANWQLGEKDRARRWYQQSMRWIAANPANTNKWFEQLRAQATNLLGVPEQSAPASQSAGPSEVEIYTLVLEADPLATWARTRRGDARLRGKR